MDENGSLTMMKIAGALNPDYQSQAKDFITQREHEREQEDLRKFEPIYRLIYADPEMAFRELYGMRPKSAKGAKAYLEMMKASKQEAETYRKHAAAQAATDPDVWKPVETTTTLPAQSAATPTGRKGEEEFAFTPPRDVTTSKPAEPTDVVGRLPFYLREYALDPIQKMWSMRHGGGRTESDRLASDLDQKRKELRDRGMDPYNGPGADEYRRFYAERNPTSALAQKIISGDAGGEVPDVHRQIASNYDQRVEGMWSALSDEEKQLLEPQHSAVQEAIETLRIDPKTKPQQTIARIVEFSRQVTSVREFNKRMGFQSERFKEAKSQFDQAMTLKRQAAELHQEESQERSEERQLRIRERRFRVNQQSNAMAIRAFQAMAAFLSNLRFMASDDPAVQRMREIALQMMQYYQTEFPGLSSGGETGGGPPKGGGTVAPRPAPGGTSAPPAEIELK